MRNKVRRRIFIITGIVTLFALAGAVISVLIERHVTEKSENEFVLQAEEKQNGIREFIGARTDILDLIATFMGGESLPNAEELSRMKTLEMSISARRLGVYIPTADTCLDTNGLQYSLYDISIWEDTLAGNNAISYLKDTGRIVLSTRWIRNGEVAGMLMAEFDSQPFSMKISEPVFNHNGTNLLVDDNGEIIVNTVSPEFYDDKGNFLLAEETPGALKLMDYIRHFEEDADRVAEISINGTRYLVYGAGLPDYNGVIVVSMAKSEDVYGVTRKTVGLIAGLFVLTVVVLVFQVAFAMITGKKRDEEMERAISYDDLTNLPLKSLHKETVAAILEKGEGKYAYAIADVTGFKFVNSTLGYEYGNRVLKYIADILSKAVTKDENVCRTSGDHFAMLLKYDTVDELVKRLETMLNYCTEVPENDEGKAAKIFFRCGVYLINGNEDVNRIRSRANVARKGIGKSMSNEIAFYSDEDFNKDIEQHELESDLLNSIKNEELVVYLQPKYGIPEEKVIGAEALIRWNHPEKGMIAPNMFIPIAEVDGFVKEIDFYVFETVCRKLRDWKRAGRQLITVSVNFSRLHLYDEDFVGNLIRLSKEYEIEPKYLEIELTETAIYDEMDRLLDVMYLIKDAGFGLSMDDFGSGYSSLHLLREMPVDVLKLDKGFLDECGNADNAREQKVISHVISMAKDLDITVLAEGVETVEQKNFLQNASCDVIQGYYYSKPMPIDDFGRKYFKR